MPRQNRVDPFGNIVAHPARGMLMGNRGCLHDNDGRIVRTNARPAWITCLPSWPGVRRQLMKPGHYTELFFLDEVTAMAAGHRPCGSCRPEALAAFKTAWQRAFDLPSLPLVAEIDEVLRSASILTSTNLPAGSFVALDKDAYLVVQDALLLWTIRGYERSERTLGAFLRPLTPTAMIAVLRNGYMPLFHDSAGKTFAGICDQ